MTIEIIFRNKQSELFTIENVTEANHHGDPLVVSTVEYLDADQTTEKSRNDKFFKLQDIKEVNYFL